MATTGRKSGTRQGARRGAPQQQRRRQHQDEAGVIPVLARTVRAIENSAERGKVITANHARSSNVCTPSSTPNT